MAHDLGERVATLEANYGHLNAKLDEIGSDVKSLLTSRSEQRGGWKAIVAAASASGGVGGALVAFLSWLRGH